MWIAFAALSALFAGITSVLAKCGIKQTSSNTATAIRTIVVLIFSWIMVFIAGSHTQIDTVSKKSWIFLILSGIATGASWLCYFKALQSGDVNKVVPIDKSSTVLTILLSFIILHEEITIAKGIGIVLIAAGTFLMIQKKTTEENNEEKKPNKKWIIYAVLSAVFASLTAILSKIGITGVESNLGTAIRTCVVLFMAWITVFAAKEQNSVKYIPKKELLFICLSGIATGASWLCYYKALQDGITGAVVAIDKLSIIITVIFSFVFFKEKLSAKGLAGLLLLICGTVAMLF